MRPGNLVSLGSPMTHAACLSPDEVIANPDHDVSFGAWASGSSSKDAPASDEYHMAPNQTFAAILVPSAEIAIALQSCGPPTDLSIAYDAPESVEIHRLPYRSVAAIWVPSELSAMVHHHLLPADVSASQLLPESVEW
mmetsp:Transcript_580/g.1885  ORF Transcript_580/g.1885 Transcript_580/m.1885 type:complete len:138 (-) Transcript_580:112-525(-)